MHTVEKDPMNLAEYHNIVDLPMFTALAESMRALLPGLAPECTADRLAILRKEKSALYQPTSIKRHRRFDVASRIFD